MREAVTMVDADRTVEEVATRLGMAPGTLWYWVTRQRHSKMPEAARRQ